MYFYLTSAILHYYLTITVIVCAHDITFCLPFLLQKLVTPHINLFQADNVDKNDEIFPEFFMFYDFAFVKCSPENRCLDSSNRS